jgi:hypothetical protein
MSGSLVAYTPLIANAEFVGTAQDRLVEVRCAALQAFVFADKAGTLYYQESDDNVVWVDVQTFIPTVSILLVTPWLLRAKRYGRFKFVNGAVDQTIFNLYQEKGTEEDVGPVFFARDVKFHNAEASGVGAIISVGGYSTLVLEIFGTSTPTGEVDFKASGASGYFSPISGKKLSDGTSGIKTTTIPSGATPIPELWQFDVTGLSSFQCPATLTAGLVTVLGRLVP